MSYVVTFEATGQTREVRRACRRCLHHPHQLNLVTDWPYVVVSKRGTAHTPGDYGRTECGIDATGDDWWWPA